MTGKMIVIKNKNTVMAVINASTLRRAKSHNEQMSSIRATVENCEDGFVFYSFIDY
ncbi:hypothetical protein UABAM_04585 [Candidatus Uabimicrobium amorphum]|uniref:Uncharacterized protein n=1 Tax=Uabimicrobium amorphum TaxID=2596890 RepID=A0A5S9F621_UABAM|nr:hypothetical protein UABAM_04585 [Candidatus Uabimicrobium amorphum]